MRFIKATFLSLDPWEVFSQSWKMQTLMPRHVQGVATDGSTVPLWNEPSWPCTPLPRHRQLFPEEGVRTATSVGPQLSRHLGSPRDPYHKHSLAVWDKSTQATASRQIPRETAATRQLPESGNQLRNLSQAVMFRFVMWGNEADTPQHRLRVSTVFGSKLWAGEMARVGSMRAWVCFPKTQVRKKQDIVAQLNPNTGEVEMWIPWYTASKELVVLTSSLIRALTQEGTHACALRLIHRCVTR